jgi:hypothetical protein
VLTTLQIIRAKMCEEYPDPAQRKVLAAEMTIKDYRNLCHTFYPSQASIIDTMFSFKKQARALERKQKEMEGRPCPFRPTNDVNLLKEIICSVLCGPDAVHEGPGHLFGNNYNQENTSSHALEVESAAMTTYPSIHQPETQGHSWCPTGDLNGEAAVQKPRNHAIPKLCQNTLPNKCFNCASDKHFVAECKLYPNQLPIEKTCLRCGGCHPGDCRAPHTGVAVPLRRPRQLDQQVQQSQEVPQAHVQPGYISQGRQIETYGKERYYGENGRDQTRNGRDGFENFRFINNRWVNTPSKPQYLPYTGPPQAMIPIHQMPIQKVN